MCQKEKALKNMEHVHAAIITVNIKTYSENVISSIIN